MNVNTTYIIMAILYAMLGTVFVFLAISFSRESVWNFTTLALVAMAALDYGLAIRAFLTIKRNTKNK